MTPGQCQQAEYIQQRTSRKPVKKCKIRTQNQENHKLLECFCKNEKIEIFPGDVGDDFFRAPRLRAVPALRSSLLQYSKGFALLPFKNGVEIAAVEGGRPVSMVMPSPKVGSGPAVIWERRGRPRGEQRR